MQVESRGSGVPPAVGVNGLADPHNRRGRSELHGCVRSRQRAIRVAWIGARPKLRKVAYVKAYPAGESKTSRQMLLEFTIDVEVHGDRRRNPVLEIQLAWEQSQHCIYPGSWVTDGLDNGVWATIGIEGET